MNIKDTADFIYKNVSSGNVVVSCRHRALFYEVGDSRFSIRPFPYPVDRDATVYIDGDGDVGVDEMISYYRGHDIVVIGGES